jgi:hypothetical protein
MRAAKRNKISKSHILNARKSRWHITARNFIARQCAFVSKLRQRKQAAITRLLAVD